MSEPIRNYKDRLHGAIEELISAESALNMEPSPVVDTSDTHYLTDVDMWVAHAYKHICAAIHLINEERASRGLRSVVFTMGGGKEDA